MPNPHSVAMGCYICKPEEIVPILSNEGLPIDLFQASCGGSNSISLLDGRRALIVPHGWGKTSTAPLEVLRQNDNLWVNGEQFPVSPQSSLGKHPGLVLRSFDTNPTSCNSFYGHIKDHCHGRVVDQLAQLCWYNKHGLNRGHVD